MLTISTFMTLRLYIASLFTHDKPDCEYNAGMGIDMSLRDVQFCCPFRDSSKLILSILLPFLATQTWWVILMPFLFG